MLLANEVIAKRALQAKVPFIYRVHEPPESGKMEQLRDFAATFGHRLGGRTGAPAPRDLQRLLTAAAGTTESSLISTVVLRSMRQARYSEQSLGHFGLAMNAYTHFTSPIRRYPDLIVHRLAGRLFIEGGRPWLSEEALADVARSSSERERIAVAAERDSKDLKKVEFMERHLGADFGGTISGVTAFGFFVVLDDFFVDGLVHVSSLDDDYYLFIEAQHALIGERTRRRFRTGDRVRVKVAKVDLEERRIDFQLIEEKSGGGARGRRGRTRR
jgi:ribonuclease R